MMKETYEHWMSNAKCPDKTTIKIAVNTQDQRDQLKEFDNVIVVGDEHRGVTHAACELSRSTVANPNDIIMLISDDFYAFKDWDVWVRKQLSTFDGCLMVNDGYQEGNCITIPIMTYNCLLRLNKILYHTSYRHEYSDVELYDNLAAMGLVKNLRTPNMPTFKHKHWANGMREFDEADKKAIHVGGVDIANYNKRKKMPLNKRLEI